jgi:hypothetical protein
MNMNFRNLNAFVEKVGIPKTREIDHKHHHDITNSVNVHALEHPTKKPDQGVLCLLRNLWWLEGGTRNTN